MPTIQIKDFEEKVAVVRGYRAAEAKKPAIVKSAIGSGYRITLIFDGNTHIFSVSDKDLPKLMAEFPGVTELWRLFSAG